MTKISIQNLQKSFGDNHVLKGVNLDIKQGEIMFVVGKSGTGKSVLLKNIAGLLNPDKGQILIDGKNILHFDEKEIVELRKKVGVLFQMAGLFDSLTVFENVAFTLNRFTNYSKAEIKEMVFEKLGLVGMQGYEYANPASLSLGMQKRVGLARAIAMKPEIILCDEPTTGVDPLLGAAVDDLISKLNEELGVTVLVISHDMESVFRLATRVAMLYQGNFIFTGTTEEFKSCEDARVRQFVEGSAHGPIAI
ncbi:MAG: ABC transporter ATP-binding protein [Leptospirales bacterium]